MVTWPYHSRFSYQWRDWFAWYPVRIGADWVWLERVSYRYNPTLTRDWEYVRLR
jgi:hypothetical protein